MPLISVIVPVYKVEKYLCRCVDSILKQSFVDFELILVDDGSPDRSGEMCDDYAAQDSRVRVIHKENGGLSDARNAGIEAAQGKYLFFIDSDDVIHPDTMRILLDVMDKADAQAAVGGFERFGDGDAVEKRFAEWDNSYRCICGEEAIVMMFEPWKYKHNMVSACCKLFPREWFDNVRFPVGRIFEDEFTVHKLYVNAAKVALADIILYYYFSNDDGITGTLSLEQWLHAYDARYERILFLEQNASKQVYDTALREFLRWAQWDLIKCRKGEEAVEKTKKERFEQQFLDVFERARKRKAIHLAEHLDYYMLAKPQWSIWWRIKKKIF